MTEKRNRNKEKGTAQSRTHCSTSQSGRKGRGGEAELEWPTLTDRKQRGNDAVDAMMQAKRKRHTQRRHKL